MNCLFIVLFKGYKRFLSPILPGACRFTPTCSEYGIQAFQTYPFLYALYLTFHRIVRCNPLSEGFEDPLPLPDKKS